jgi:hypothetical protein
MVSEEQASIFIYDDNGQTIVIIRADEKLTDWHHERADKIAAVPELIEACEAALEIVGVYDEGVGLTLEERQLEQIIYAALAKARGE